MNSIDAFKAAGLNPIVIDENFDFNSLNGLLTKTPPFEVLEAAETVGRWFAEQNLTVWKCGPCESRKS